MTGRLFVPHFAKQKEDTRDQGGNCNVIYQRGEICLLNLTGAFKVGKLGNAFNGFVFASYKLNEHNCINLLFSSQTLLVH